MDLREFSNNDEIMIKLESGEQFEGVVVDRDYDPPDEFTSGFISFAFEGDWWSRVNDRVDSEVLQIRQEFARKTAEPQKAKLLGSKLVQESRREIVEIGVIKSISEVGKI